MEAEKKTSTTPEIAAKIERVAGDYEAGIPTDSTVRWISLSPVRIQRKLQSEGEEISCYLISNTLKDLGYRKRRYSKDQCSQNPENRDAQFTKIALLKSVFSREGLPVLSIDTKQKEMIGCFDRGESYYGKEKRSTLDHDFLSHASGVVVPHGIYDCFQNKGYITLGQSKDNFGICLRQHLILLAKPFAMDLSDSRKYADSLRWRRLQFLPASHC